MIYRLEIDIGGTLTGIVLLDDRGGVRTALGINATQPPAGVPIDQAMTAKLRKTAR